MAVRKRETQSGATWDAFAYHPGLKRKVYVGTRRKKRDAEDLVNDKHREFRGQPTADEMTLRDYSERWLEFKHGEGTRRPRPSTLRHNRQMLKRFLEEFGDAGLSSIPRNEALDWALKHRSDAKTVSAMFNDAVNDSLISTNPFFNRQHKQMRGRKDIKPITETEVGQLASIAMDHWGKEYGRVCKAWILWSAWVGSRPGETFGVEWPDLDLRKGEVTIRRVKPPYHTDVVAVASPVLDAIREMRVAPEGLLFKTVTGKRIDKGANRYYWDPVRSIFEAKLSPERRAELREDGKPLALYSLRHFCASIIVASGGNEYDCAAQLGNTPEVCRETYIHDFATERRRRLRGLLEGGEVVSLRSVKEEGA